jgi:signal transduction histidine kinase
MKSVTIPFKMHPRVFESLGIDLVTSDTVAIMELVKNSYDAGAVNVRISFENGTNGEEVIKIEDDGIGMTRDIIENVWAVVATPYKTKAQYIGDAKTRRRVSGEKGLGRLSLARLGESVTIITKALEDGCFEIDLNWQELIESRDIDAYGITLTEIKEDIFKSGHGAIILIKKLKAEWSPVRIGALESDLARLLSPFSNIKNFNLLLADHGTPFTVNPPSFLFKPKYLLKGSASRMGDINYSYKFDSFGKSDRNVAGVYNWFQIYSNLKEDSESKAKSDKYSCGSFEFEIRAWDLDRDGIAEISEKYEVNKQKIRKAIRDHKGISVYRDNILVIPKSESARDWLGLDLRRVSRVGLRLSTSQIVGYVSITSENNPQIRDSSDREKLVKNTESDLFQEMLIQIVKLLENERKKDKDENIEVAEITDLFKGLDGTEVLDEIESLAADGRSAREAIPLIKDFTIKVDDTRKNLQERFVYYSRMAAVGTIAQMLIHEIRNRTTILGSFVRMVQERISTEDKEINKYTMMAISAIDNLEKLADNFAPLASRTFSRKKRHSDPVESLDRMALYFVNDFKRLKIIFANKIGKCVLAVDPGELEPIFYNLISNGVYWLSQVKDGERQLVFRSRIEQNRERLRIFCDDSGPGIADEDLNKVLLPGVTRKPGGIGMGLTVVSELVAGYEGKFSIRKPGTLNGASFEFDLPVKEV